MLCYQSESHDDDTKMDFGVNKDWQLILIPVLFLSLLKVFRFCSDGNILDLGRDVEIENRYAKSSFERVLDVRGKTIVPGMVDAHTHPVWAGDRVHEFALKVM